MSSPTGADEQPNTTSHSPNSAPQDSRIQLDRDAPTSTENHQTDAPDAPVHASGDDTADADSGVNGEAEAEAEADAEVEAEGEAEAEAEAHSPVHRFDDEVDVEPNTPPTSSAQPSDSNKFLAGDKGQSPTSPSEQPDEQPDAAPSLLTALAQNPSGTHSLATVWLAQLATNGPAAVAAILSLVVAVGKPFINNSNALITSQMVVQNQISDSLTNLAPTLAAETKGRVPILAKDAQSRRIRRSFNDFWRILCAEAGDVVIFDTDCFETLISWLEVMAGASSRGLRTAACLASYRIVDGYIAISNRLQKELSSMQRQFATEKTKCGFIEHTGRSTSKSSRQKSKPLSEKGKDLSNKVELLTANYGEVTELCDKVFRSIFILKYRDIAADIRIISVNALGVWTMSFPKHFLDDVHNKYIGWLLSDKDAGVRKASLDVLRAMMRKEDFFPSLELFLQRFSDRIVEMSRDKDDTVAIAAIQLLSCLVPYNMIAAESCEAICDMAIEEPQMDIRRAAGEFLAQMIKLEPAVSSAGSTSSSAKKKRPSKPPYRKGRPTAAMQAESMIGDVPSLEISREHIKQLLRAVTQKGIDTSPSFAVDAVWNHLPALRCWDAFDDLLLEHDNVTSKASKRRSSSSRSRTAARIDGGEQSLSESDRAVLCEILMLSATEASGHGEKSRAKAIHQLDTDDGDSPGMVYSRHMIGQLPKMLTQFQADARAMTALVQLPMHFNVQLLEQEGREEHLKTLLNRLVDALTRHTGLTSVTLSCSDTFRALLSDENPLKGVTSSMLQLACKKAANELSVAVRSELADSEPETVAAALLRVRVLSELVEPIASVHESVMKLLQYQMEKGETSSLPEDVSSDAARTAFGLTIWSLLKVRSRIGGMHDGGLTIEALLDMAEMKDAQTKGGDVTGILVQICSSNNLGVSVKMICLQGLLTLLTLCCGIERFASEALVGVEKNLQEERKKAEDMVDILRVKSRRDEIAESVKQCVVAVVEHEYAALKKRGTVRSQNGSTTSKMSTGEDLKDCFAVLIQASVQSAICKEICHLPLLGLISKGRRVRDGDRALDVSTLDLCRHYYEKRILRSGGITENEIRALVDCGAMESDKTSESNMSSEFVDALVSFRRGSVERDAAAVQIGKALCRWIIDEEKVVDTVVSEVRLLCNIGTGLLGFLTEEGAKIVRKKVKNVEEMMEEDWIVDECGEVGASVEGFVKALEVLEQGGTRVGKRKYPAVTIGKAGDEGQNARKSVRCDDGDNDERVKEVLPTPLRKSSRGKKRINYAQMEEGTNNLFENSEVAGDGERDAEEGTSMEVKHSEAGEGIEEVEKGHENESGRVEAGDEIKTLQEVEIGEEVEIGGLEAERDGSILEDGDEEGSTGIQEAETRSALQGGGDEKNSYGESNDAQSNRGGSENVKSKESGAKNASGVVDVKSKPGKKRKLTDGTVTPADKGDVAQSTTRRQSSRVKRRRSERIVKVSEQVAAADEAGDGLSRASNDNEGEETEQKGSEPNCSPVRKRLRSASSSSTISSARRKRNATDGKESTSRPKSNTKPVLRRRRQLRW